MPTGKRSVRGAAGFPVRIVVDDATDAGVAENFSCSGMLIQTEAALEIGDVVRLEVELPLGGIVILDGAVVRVVGPNGIGVCFDDVQPDNDPANLRRLGELLVDGRARAEVDGSTDVPGSDE